MGEKILCLKETVADIQKKACSMCIVDIRIVCEIVGHLGDLATDGRIILQLI